MTYAQLLHEIRKELAMNERLTSLIKTAAKQAADADLRRTYSQLGHPEMLRLTGAAAGVEDFAKSITAEPNKFAGKLNENS